MIKFTKGNILDSKADALINTVNTVGVMGKGIALQFKKAFPSNFNSYKKACSDGLVDIGRLYVSKDYSLTSGEKYIINFPTKTHWRKPSEYDYIKLGLSDLKRVIKEYDIKSIAIPPLGAGNGGLNWERVKELIKTYLEDESIEIIVYEPTTQIKDRLKKERVKLTPARALLLNVLYDLVRNGDYVSEFSSEKVAYFLQKFGAKKYLKLSFQQNFYGPYSGKVRFLLNALNGSYIMGYSDMNKKPFEPLTLVGDGFHDVENYINSNPELKEIATKTKCFLSGFYSDFGLELLSSIDFVSKKIDTFNKEEIKVELDKWSERKRTMFSNPRYLDISIRHLSNSKE
ncbi:MAG: macro domain-containing protein [Cyclobacteriaceae bacterium]|nr:macro domain-containing protein [Cyclobacteriaceae bacterium]MCH8518100.1 macro domain-containing protein [Cyclobacteriaceae bacterium]